MVASLPSEQRELVRSVFLRLTELGEGVADTRRRVSIGELVPEGASPEVVETLLERLAEARLVTLGEGTAEVAHEVLIREWPTLRGWLAEDREGMRLHRQLGDAARLWEAGGRETTDLYRGSRLDAAADRARTHPEDINAGERAFVDAGLERAAQERRTERRTNRRLRGLLAGAVILLAVALLAGAVSLVQRDRARAQALTSDAERIGAQALTDQHVDRSLLLAVAAVELQNRVETRSDLLAVLQRNPALVRFGRPFGDLLTGVQVSHDGSAVGRRGLGGSGALHRPRQVAVRHRRAAGQTGGATRDELLPRRPHADGGHGRRGAVRARGDRRRHATGTAGPGMAGGSPCTAIGLRGRGVLA